MTAIKRRSCIVASSTRTRETGSGYASLILSSKPVRKSSQRNCFVHPTRGDHAMLVNKRYAIGFSAAFFAALISAPAAEPDESRSALQKDSTGWINLLETKDLKNWKRVPIPPGSPLNSKNPWSIEPDTNYL